MAVMATFFISCTRLDSKKVDPNIIGTAYLQYDVEEDYCYAVIDSTKYPVSKVLIPSKKGYDYIKICQIMHVDEVNVTLFTSPHLKGVKAVVGKQNAIQIKESCQTQIKFYLILGWMLAAAIGFIVWWFCPFITEP